MPSLKAFGIVKRHGSKFSNPWKWLNVSIKEIGNYFHFALTQFVCPLRFQFFISWQVFLSYFRLRVFCRREKKYVVRKFVQCATQDNTNDRRWTSEITKVHGTWCSFAVCVFVTDVSIFSLWHEFDCWTWCIRPIYASTTAVSLPFYWKKKKKKNKSSCQTEKTNTSNVRFRKISNWIFGWAGFSKYFCRWKGTECFKRIIFFLRLCMSILFSI